MGNLGTEVAGGLIVAAILGAIAWLRSEGRRERAVERARQLLCRHQWEPVPVELMTGDDYWCVKCDARR